MKTIVYQTFTVFFLSNPQTVESIIGCHCQCEAGQSQSCIHIAATLVMLAHLSKRSVTSMTYVWDKPSSSHAEHTVFASNLNLGSVSKARRWNGPLA
jgi:hypothetical protein